MNQGRCPISVQQKRPSRGAQKVSSPSPMPAIPPGVLRPAQNESPNRSPTALALPVRFGLGEFAALEKVFVSATYVTLELGMLPGRTPYNHR